MVNIYCYSCCDNHLIFTDLIKCRNVNVDIPHQIIKRIHGEFIAVNEA